MMASVAGDAESSRDFGVVSNLEQKKKEKKEEKMETETV